VRALLTITLLFSVFFCSVALLLGHEYIVGVISPRGLGIALAALFVASVMGVAFLLKSGSSRKSILKSGDEGSWRGRVLAIWAGKIAVVVLMLVFLNGLWHIRQRPLAPRLVGLGANLLVTFAVIGAVRKIKRGSK